MTIDRIRAVYFSPTGGTQNVVRMLAGDLAEALGLPWEYETRQEDGSRVEVDLTPPEARDREYHFGPNDLVVAGSPVYAGRMPNKIAPDFRRCLISSGGERAAAVPVVVFGNRSCGGALTELRQILVENGFRPIGGAAVVTRHAFTDALAAGRPDEADREEIRAFARRIAETIRNTPADADATGVPDVIEGEELPPYYTPLKEDGTPARFLKAKPVTDPALCDLCGICRAACPMGSVDGRMEADGICIKCQACVRKCPKRAKSFTDEEFLSHVRMLEQNYTRRAENHFLL